MVCLTAGLHTQLKKGIIYSHIYSKLQPIRSDKMAKKDKIGFDTSAIPSKGKIGWVIDIVYEKIGSQWKIKKINNFTITKQNLINYSSNETLSFFKMLGGTERRDFKYTQYGYIPARIVSINPDKTIKHMWEFYYGQEGQSYKYYLAKYKMEKEKQKLRK